MGMQVIRNNKNIVLLVKLGLSSNQEVRNMHMIKKDAREPLIPELCLNQGTSDLVLEDGNLNIGYIDKEYRLKCKLVIKLHRSPKLVIKASCSDPSTSNELMKRLFDGDQVKFTYNDNEVLCSVSGLSFSSNSSEKATALELMVLEDFYSKGNMLVLIDSIKFHLINFPSLIGNKCYWYKGKGEGDYCTRRSIELTNSDWSIEIQPDERCDEKNKEVEELSKYHITYVGTIRKQDGSTFEVSKAESILEALAIFLTLAIGQNTVIYFPFGYCGTEEVWRKITVPAKIEANRENWLTKTKAKTLTDIFPKFLYRLEEDKYSSILKHAIRLYGLASTSSFTLVGIQIAETALDQIAVMLRKAMPCDFKEIKLNECVGIRISQLMKKCSIDDSIPNDRFQKELLKLYNTKKRKTITHTVIDVRNALIHPENDDHEEINPILEIEAMDHILWQLEMTILRLIGYQGEYSDRRERNKWSGEVKQVPWVMP